jgi:hypothetical protein
VILVVADYDYAASRQKCGPCMLSAATLMLNEYCTRVAAAAVSRERIYLAFHAKDAAEHADLLSFWDYIKRAERARAPAKTTTRKKAR